MADQIWYRDGKVSVETGNNVVVGLGTFWMTTVRVGDMFAVTKDGPVKEFYEILSVDEDRQITLSQPWQGANETNVEYAIIRNFTGRWSISADLAYQVESLVRQFKTALQNNLKGDKGDPGKDGNTVLGGPGAPTPTDGKEGDWYLDSQTWDIYRKEAGGWIRRGSLVGPKGEPGKDGVRWYYDETPSASVGNIGDINFNGTTGDVHRRTTTGWELIGNFKGPQGKQGPKGDTGPKGDPARWFSGSGAPSGGTGTNGDMYLNVDTGETYRKASDLWVLQGSIKGRVGDRGPAGPAGMTWRGVWNSSTEYVPNDAVQHVGNVWIAKAGNTNVSPPATASTPSNSAWDLLVPKGADGLGSGDMLKSVYDPDNSGKVLSAKTAERATTADNATAAGRAATAPWGGIEDVPNASLSALGVVQLSTSEATKEGTSETLAVTPAGLKSLLEDEQKGIPILVQGENISIEVDGRQYTIKANVPPPPAPVDIVNALDSDRTDAALSAAQGKVLKGAVDEKAASVHQHEEGDITGLSAALTDKAPKIHQHQISDVVNLAEQLASSGGLSVIDLSQDPSFLKPEMQVDSTAPVIAIPELGIFRYDAASMEIIDGETCLATKSGVGRYLLLVPDASWLSMVAIRDARRLMELNRREVITTTIALPSMTVPANGLVSRDVACHEVELGDSVEILTLVPLAGNIAVYGLVGSLGVIRMVVMNSNQGHVSTPNMVLVIKINKEASV